MPKAVPPGFHTVTPALRVRGCAEAIELYKKAFGAQELGRVLDPSGTKIMHAVIKIGDSIIMMNDEMPEMDAAAIPSALYLYVEDVDTLWKRAVDAGLKIEMPLADMFWGDRMGNLLDRFDIEWSLASRVKDLSPEEMKRAQEQAMKEWSKGG